MNCLVWVHSVGQNVQTLVTNSGTFTHGRFKTDFSALPPVSSGNNGLESWLSCVNLYILITADNCMCVQPAVNAVIQSLPVNINWADTAIRFHDEETKWFFIWTRGNMLWVKTGQKQKGKQFELAVLGQISANTGTETCTQKFTHKT